MIIRNIKYTLLILLASVILPAEIVFCFGQIEKTDVEDTMAVQTDHSQLQVQPVPKNKIEDYRNSDDFKYYYQGIERKSLFAEFLEWLIKKILGWDNLDEGLKGINILTQIIKYILMAGFVAFIIYVLAGGKLSAIFSKNKKLKSGNGFDYFEEDIYQSDIDKKLNKAIQNRDYRTAIRYYYLILLKKLDANELIQWELGKTNRDYQRELSTTPVLDEFIKLSGVYEYSWYGNFEVNEEKFYKYQSGFKDVFKHVG